MPADYIGFLYASAVVTGGVIGFVKSGITLQVVIKSSKLTLTLFSKTGSTPSLVAGLLFGAALGYGAYEASKQPPNYIPQIATGLTLGSMMAFRYLNSGKFMPAGLITALSAVVVLRSGYHMYELRK